VGLIISLSTHAAHAENSQVPIHQRDCPDEWQEPLVKLIDLELQSLLEERPRAQLSDVRSVTVSCTVDRIVVTVISTKGKIYNRTLTRDLDEQDAAAQPRVVALTAAELADSIWLVAPRPAKEAPPRPYRHLRVAGQRWVLLVGGMAELLGKPSLVGLGAELAVEHYALPMLALRLQARGSFARSADRDGTEIRARSWTGVASALFGEHATEQGQRWSWGFGPGVRVGWAQIVGIPVRSTVACPSPSGCDLQGDAVHGIWFGPVLTGRLAYIWSNAVVLALSVEGGLVTRSIIGADSAGTALFGYDGPWLGAGLSVGSAF
jgi:hypothetical protein